MTAKGLYDYHMHKLENPKLSAPSREVSEATIAELTYRIEKLPVKTARGDTCPECGCYVYQDYHYCPDCGQALLWEEV